MLWHLTEKMRDVDNESITLNILNGSINVYMYFYVL